jgi:hypothetical protein
MIPLLPEIEYIGEEKVSEKTHFKGLKRRFILAVHNPNFGTKKILKVNVYEGLLLEYRKRLFQRPPYNSSLISIIDGLIKALVTYSHETRTVNCLILTSDRRIYGFTGDLTIAELIALGKYLDSRRELY